MYHWHRPALNKDVGDSFNKTAAAHIRMSFKALSVKNENECPSVIREKRSGKRGLFRTS